MPYCLSCGTKTDFETTDCPDCGQAITRRIDPPGETVEAGPGRAVSGEAVDDADDEVGATATDSSAEADSTAQTETVPTTDPSGPSPFADRWALPFAAGYPVRDDYRSLTVGGILEFLGLFVPLFSLVTVGYGFRLLRATARGQAGRPAFDEYGQLFVEGLKCAFVVALYGAVGFAGSVAAIVAGSADEPLGLALWVTVAFVSVYPLPASLTVYGATDDLRAAFARGHAGRFATSWTYLKAWVVWLVGLAVATVLTGLSLVTLAGPVVVRAWSTCALATLWGYYYREAAARDAVPPAPDEPVA